MKTPAFWYEPAGLTAFCLRPLGWIYGLVTAWRMARGSVPLGVPVICVGNFTAGGAGKTPAVIGLSKILNGMNERVYLVSRGYGGSQQGPVRVNPGKHTAADCGDEPLLLALHAPTIVSKDRAAGVRAAIADGATVVLLDDGLQSKAVHKDITVCVVDGSVGVGNGQCVPAGPLRAPLESQLPFVDLVIVLGEGLAGQAVAETASRSGKPWIKAHVSPDARDVEALRNRRLLAFAGIGRPEKFFTTLRGAGLDVVSSKGFADHRVYSNGDLETLSRLARQQNLTLVTTEKDAVRIGSGNTSIMVLGIVIQWDDTGIRHFLESHLARKRSSPDSSASGNRPDIKR
jgi:tetraacyldisaccharide 4'-kinase